MGSPPSTAEIQQQQQQHHQNRCREVWASSSTADIRPTNPQITSHEPGSFKLVVSKKGPWDSQSKTANAPGDPSWNLRRTGNPSWNLLRGAKASCAQVARLPSKLQGYQIATSIIAFMRPKIQPPTRCLTGPPTRRSLDPIQSHSLHSKLSRLPTTSYYTKSQHEWSQTSTDLHLWEA